MADLAREIKNHIGFADPLVEAGRFTNTGPDHPQFIANRGDVIVIRAATFDRRIDDRDARTHLDEADREAASDKTESPGYQDAFVTKWHGVTRTLLTAP
jgi:hypothetical protein